MKYSEIATPTKIQGKKKKILKFVYLQGVLPDGRVVAVKRLYMGRRHADAEFLNEANLISRVQHRNLVKLLGCSVEGSERILVYEYLPNSSLDKFLFGFYSFLIP